MGRMSFAAARLCGLFAAVLLGSASPASETISYTYDALGRVTAVSSSGSVNNGQAVAISYDAAGNRTSYAVTGAVLELSVADASATEGGDLVFTVTLSSASASNVTVAYAITGGSATSGSDYTFTPDTLTFTPGQTSKTITVSTVDDSSPEADETVTLTLSSPSGATIADGTATGTISDNDQPVTLSVSDASATEGGNLTFTVSLSQVSGGTVTVDYATADATATAGSDYTAASGSLTFTPGQTTRTVTVATATDSNVEAAETLSLVLSSPSGATIADGSGTGTINDGDPPDVTFAISDASITEGGTLSFTVTKSGLTFSTLSVSYATSDISAIAGSDYTAKTGTLSFSLLEFSKTITVSTTQDTVEEALETLQVTLSSPTGGSGLTDSVGIGSIVDDDGPLLSIADASATEGGSLSFTVTRSGGTASAASASYATADGTATAGSDYTAATGTVSFASGETSKTITVNTSDDTASEGPEAFTVVLSAPSSGTTIADGTATGTINDNDAAPAEFSIANATGTEGGSLSFTVTRSGATTTSVSVSYATGDGSAVAGSDYTAASGTLTFSAGQTSKTVTVSTINDTAVEAPETLSVTLSSPSSGAIVTGATGTGTINDNDVGLAISNRSVDEGTAFSFTVTRSGSTTGSVSVNYATSNVTATAGSDYTATSGTLTFAAGETSKTITVNTTNDSVAEANETLNVTLSSPTGGAVLLDAVGVGTIRSDELGFLISDESRTESGSFSFTVTKVGTATGATTVSYATSDGTATAGSDYTAKTGTLNFSTSETSETISVSIKTDSVAEADETLFVTLSSPSSGALIDAVGVGTILDND